MAESDVRSLITRPVKAEFDSEQDVFVLASGGREVLTYANSLERRNLNFRQYYVDGIAVMIGSACALVIGLISRSGTCAGRARARTVCHEVRGGVDRSSLRMIARLPRIDWRCAAPKLLVDAPHPPAAGRPWPISL